jgi:hypothetical protein
MSSIEVFNWAMVLGCTATAAIFLAAMAVGDASRAANDSDIVPWNAALRDRLLAGSCLMTPNKYIAAGALRQEHPEFTKAREHAERQSSGPPEPQFPRLHQPHPHIDQYFIGYNPESELSRFSATWDDLIDLKEPTE